MRFGRLLRDMAVAAAFPLLLGALAWKMNGRPEILGFAMFYVVDGDTLSRRGERLRLLGIDAPEYDQQCERGGAVAL